MVLLGVEFAIAIGLLAFLLNFIPNIGSVIATLLPVPILLLGDYSATTVFLVLSLTFVVQFTIGNVVEPKVLGKSLGLHPVVVLLGLVVFGVVFGVVWGIPGMFLSTPLIAVAKISISHNENGKSIAQLLEGDLSVLGKSQDQSTSDIV